MSVKHGTQDVPTQVFDKFLQALVEAGISADTVSRLRKTILDDKNLTEVALEEAVLSEEPVA